MTIDGTTDFKIGDLVKLKAKYRTGSRFGVGIVRSLGERGRLSVEWRGKLITLCHVSDLDIAWWKD